MKTRKEYVVEVMKELVKLTNLYGYRAVEVAYLINDIGTKTSDEITDEQVNKVNDTIDTLDKIIDDYVDEEVYKIMNEEV